MSLQPFYRQLATDPEAFARPRKKARSMDVRLRRQSSAVMSYVAERFEITPLELRSRGNYADLTTPRHIAMFLTQELQGLSLPLIGWVFGGWHHTTVLHAVRKIERERHSDPELERFLNEARAALKGISMSGRVPEAIGEGK